MTKYVDASPFELLEGRLLPSDESIISESPGTKCHQSVEMYKPVS